MQKLGDRIRHARELSGLTQDDIASHFTIKRVSVTQWEGNITKPAINRLSELAKLLNTTPDWLLEGNGNPPSKRKESSAILAHEKTRGFKPQIVSASVLEGAKDLPVYAAAEGGSGNIIVDVNPIEYTVRPQSLAGVVNAYGILVSGESMEPVYEQGDLAFVHPGATHRRGADVVLYDQPPDGPADGVPEAIIKRLIGWTASEWMLRQFNPPRDWSEMRSDWPTCHMIVGSLKRWR